MPAISVIIPIYNVEQYLRQCLDSVVNQTFKDLELILVNDGSPDNCGSICDEYALRDSRIIVIHKKNEGLSAARNSALEIATGEWISFVDSDDWLELDTYENLHAAAIKEDPDVLLYNPYRNVGNRENIIQVFPDSFTSKDGELIKGLQLSALSRFYTPISTKWSQGFPWDKLIKANLIQENQLRFAINVKANEDVIFAIHLFQFVKKISYIDKAFYHYRYNPTSIGTKYTENRVEIDREIYNELFKIGELYHLDQKYYQAVYARIVENTWLCATRCFFHPKNKSPLWNKIAYVKEVLKSEPYFTAFAKVEYRYLGSRARFITLKRHNNVYLIWGLHMIKKFYYTYRFKNRKIGGGEYN